MISFSSSSDDLLVEVVSLLLSLLCPSPPTSLRRRGRTAAAEAPVSPAGFASLLLGACLALMLCGSVALVLGFILMPWALGIILFLQLARVLSNLSRFWMSVLCTIRKEITSQLFSKLPMNVDL
ncbi:uncharacterized protein M6B38_146875 [Iris pallida]|uniref:Uncharacterized protein n=1 Tax=Iris pallida TaxID=29817 RepID=A0AAX6FAU0_IRIPA|nr:uncharacterized protein M6B38_146875 [Iris pallida]